MKTVVLLSGLVVLSGVTGCGDPHDSPLPSACWARAQDALEGRSPAKGQSRSRASQAVANHPAVHDKIMFEGWSGKLEDSGLTLATLQQKLERLDGQAEMIQSEKGSRRELRSLKTPRIELCLRQIGPERLLVDRVTFIGSVLSDGQQGPADMQQMGDAIAKKFDFGNKEMTMLAMQAWMLHLDKLAKGEATDPAAILDPHVYMTYLVTGSPLPDPEKLARERKQ